VRRRRRQHVARCGCSHPRSRRDRGWGRGVPALLARPPWERQFPAVCRPGLAPECQGVLEAIVVGVILAGPGWAFAIAERRRRQRAEDEQAELQRKLDAPEVTVDYGGYSREIGGLGRLVVKVVFVNKGPSVAKDVEFGVRLGSYEGKAGPGGHGKTVAAVAPNEVLNWRVVVPQSAEARHLRADQLRVEDVALVWARFVNKRGIAHEV
jgi:hypothetical protein